VTRQPLWPEWLEQHIRRVTGPEDEADTNVNGDPDSTVGDDDESGFEEMHGEPDMDFDPEDDDEDGEDE
jgi:hypothetical protein